MFSEVIKRFASSQPGTAVFSEFAEACLQLAEEDRDNAAAFTVLSMIAREFVDRFEDRPLSLPAAEREQTHLASLAREVEDSLSGDATARLAVVNRIALSQIRAEG